MVWKRTATMGRKDKRTGRKSVTDQWVKGNSMVDLRKTKSMGGKSGYVLETYDMKRKRDEIKEFYKSRSKGLKRVKMLMRRN